jgi:hypothetical protein
MKEEKVNNEIIEVATLPLSDRTLCKISEYGLFVLSSTFGIRSARIKKGKGTEQVVAKPTAPDYRSASEVALKDLLAVFAYGLGRDSEPGQSFVLVDGDARNLLPTNIVLSERRAETAEELEESEKQPKTRGASSSITTDKQIEMLSQAIAGHSYEADGATHTVKPLLQIGLAILHNQPLAEEVLANVILSLAEQIKEQKFRGNTRGEFFAWVRTSARRQFRKRLDGILEGYVGDVETDRSAIKLRKVLEYETKTSGDGPHSIGNGAYPDRAHLGFIIERDERRERERISRERQQIVA